MRRVLVTGGAGFIGSHMADGLLARGIGVSVIDNEVTGDPAYVSDAATYHRLDVRDRDELFRVFSDSAFDAVLHIAGQASCIRSFDDPQYDFQVNLFGTMNVVDACVRYGVQRLLYASSMTVYGTPEELPVGEDQLTRPISYYGISKLAAERYVLATGLRHDLDQPFRATAFRMFNVYGPRQSLDNPYQGAMAIFMSNLLRQENVRIFGDGEQSRDFVYVDDVVRVWLDSVERPSTYGRVYNVGTGNALSVNQLVSELQSLIGGAGSKVLYEEPRPGDQRHMRADVARALNDIGWSPRVSLHEGMRRTLDWARSRMAGSGDTT